MAGNGEVSFKSKTNGLRTGKRKAASGEIGQISSLRGMNFKNLASVITSCTRNKPSSSTASTERADPAK